MKTLIEGLSAVHSIERFREGSNYNSPRKPDKMAELMKRFPPVSHPVVRTHPVTGKKIKEGDLLAAFLKTRGCKNNQTNRLRNFPAFRWRFRGRQWIVTKTR